MKLILKVVRNNTKRWGNTDVNDPRAANGLGKIANNETVKSQRWYLLGKKLAAM